MRGARPLTKTEDLQIRAAFKGKMATRNLALYILGRNTGFRISEILSLKLGDVIDLDGDIKDRIQVQRRNMKGKKSSRTVKLNRAARLGLATWLAELKKKDITHRDDFIFYSIRKSDAAIGRGQVWKILHRAAHRAGLKGKVGTHSMRKTFANEIYAHFKNLLAKGIPCDPFRATSKALGHMDIKSTDKYLSFLQEDIDQAIDALT